MLSARDQDELISHLVDLLQIIGPVSARRMFGGYGFFLDGFMFGLVADNTFYLKADGAIEEHFREKGLAAFTYHKKGKVVSLSYYQAPEEVLESAEEMRTWANRSYEAALRAASKKREKTKH